MHVLKQAWRKRLKQGVSVAAAAVLATTLINADASPAKVTPTFDFDHGNALTEVIYPHFQKAVRTITPGGDDATIVADHILLVEVAWFDAIAPYNAKAVGIYSNLGRRPRSEATTRNRNIAVIYSAYTSLLAVFPQYKADFREMMVSAGLDPDNRSLNTTTPAGIGNLAATKVLEARRHDGSNRDGDEGGRKYNRQPYADYTGYEPVNTAYDLNNPSRWQPRIINNNGIVRVQQFVTPYYGRVKPISYGSPAEFSLSAPVNSDYQHNRAGYRRQAAEILEASANLDDRKKMTAEFFNDKIFSLGRTTGTAAFTQGNFDIEKAVQYVVTVDVAIFDSAIASWYFKRKYDTVRPFSAIRFLYGDKKITAWGGPGKGTVNDITGNEWRSYLNTADHADYPSTSSTYCLAYAQAARRFLGTDKLSVSTTFAKGSSAIEPGVTPAADLTLHWDNLTDLANDCRMSRVWAGVHFRAAIENAEQFAPKVGDSVYTFIQRKLNGG
ncbi:vanadium-dependent haloperoxidase [Dactylosporangium sp. NPDC050688]|uniref:vanadium-dependent haloperoxidase n=1 Tax=Dactylosporangium sp. NPDC050688 TaxID=3157217 RepID=UPI0033C0129F